MGKVSSYGEIAYKYNNLVKSRYGEKCIIVFDGYEGGLSTKDHEHSRSSTKATSSPNVSVEAENQFSEKLLKKAFLTNSRNKQSFINLLAIVLERCGHIVVKNDGDADTRIVFEVIDKASKGKSVTLIWADTDLLIMLLQQWHSDYGNIIMKTEGTKKHPLFIYIYHYIYQLISGASSKNNC